MIRELRNKFKIQSGQALLEVLIGLAVAAILIGGATAGIVMVLHSNVETKSFQVASSLGQKLIDDVKTVAEAKWYDIYSLTKGSSGQYYVAASGTTLIVLSGATTTTVGNITYTQFFFVGNVNRTSCGTASTTESSATTCTSWPGGESDITEDPSTQKITSKVQWPSSGRTLEVTLSTYLTRWRNSVSQQTDWSGGSGQDGPISEFNKNYATSSNIDYSSSTGAIIIQGF